MTKHLPDMAKELTEDLAYILGVVRGDGHISGQDIRLRVIDEDFAEMFETTLRQWSGFSVNLTKIHNPMYNNDYIYQVCLTSAEAVRFLKSFDYKTLKSASSNIKAAFLRGMYDSEGSVSQNKYIKHINLCNQNINLLSLCKTLLSDLGIKSSKIYISIKKGSRIILPGNGKPFITRRPMHNFCISSKENLIKFSTSVNFSISRKKDVVAKILNSYSMDVMEDE